MWLLWLRQNEHLEEACKGQAGLLSEPGPGQGLWQHKEPLLALVEGRLFIQVSDNRFERLTWNTSL